MTKTWRPEMARFWKGEAVVVVILFVSICRYFNDDGTGGGGGGGGGGGARYSSRPWELASASIWSRRPAERIGIDDERLAFVVVVFIIVVRALFSTHNYFPVTCFPSDSKSNCDYKSHYWSIREREIRAYTVLF